MTKISARLFTARFFSGLFLILSLAGGVTFARAANAPAVATTAADMLPQIGWDGVQKTLTVQLNQNQKIIQSIYQALQKTDPAPTGVLLARYTTEIQAVRQQTAAALTQIQTYQSAIAALIDVLGDKPQPGEPASITAQRKQAEANARAIQAMNIRAKLYDLQARQLGTLLSTLSSQIQQATLSRRSLSPLTFEFWIQVEREGVAALTSIKSASAIKDTILIPLGLLLVFLGTDALGRVLDKAIPPFLRHRKRKETEKKAALKKEEASEVGLPVTTDEDEKAPPENVAPENVSGESEDLPQLSPGWEAMESLAIGIICALVASLFWLLWSNFLLPRGLVLVDAISLNIPACTFVLGSGIPLRRWRSGTSARGLSLFLSVELMFCAFLEMFQNLGMIGNSLIAFLEAILALASATMLYMVARHLLKSAADKNKKKDTPPTESTRPNLRKPFYTLSVILLAVSVICVASGYITFAFSINNAIVDLAYALGVTGVLAGAWQMAVAVLFSPRHNTGRWLRQLGVSPRRIDQIGVLLSAAGSLALLMVLFALLQTNGDLSVGALFSRLDRIFTGTTRSGFPLSPETVITCILIIVCVNYGLNFVRTWLRTRLFPTTYLDGGAQSSIISILSYAVWILTGLSVLSLMGVSVQNLTWVVSALSVGVGFGLQSIVKDFISGLMLLAERPVQPGNVIEIGGNKGVVRRINIRATDITLPDGSTLIVPNSQFITSNVKNASFGHMPTKMSLDFTIARDTDLKKAQKLMLDAANDQQLVLALPAPSVVITALADMQIGMTLKIAFAHVEDATTLKSSLLLDILQRFHKERMNVVIN